jgi:hypothetical protein
MSKSTRIKADPYVVGDIARAESALMELATLERKTRGISDSLNDAIDKLKEAAKAETAPLDARKKDAYRRPGHLPENEPRGRAERP